MKRNIFLIIILVCLVLELSNAQSIISFGLKGGLNIANVTTSGNINTNSATGFCGGIFICLENVDKINTQIELHYIDKGFNYESRRVSSKSNETGKFSYIESAFLIYYSVTEYVSLLAGSYLSVFVSGNAKIHTEEYFDGRIFKYTDVHLISFENVNNPDFGILLGGSLRIFQQNRIELRYSLGLVSIPKFGETKFKNTGFQILLEIPLQNPDLN